MVSDTVLAVIWVTALCLAEPDHEWQVSTFPAEEVAFVLQILADCDLQLARRIKKCLGGFQLYK